MPDTLFAPDSVDALIARSLPAWLKRASLEQVRALHLALRHEQAASDSLAGVLRSIPALDDYASPLLKQALAKAGVADADVRHDQLMLTHQVLRPTLAVSVPPTLRVFRTQSSLLAAALHNFHDSETRRSPSVHGELLGAQGKVLPLTFEAYAGLCRQLDLGGGYQALLQARLQPAGLPGDTPGHQRQVVTGLFEHSLSSQFDVALRFARLKGELDERSFQQMQSLISANGVAARLPEVITPRQLYLLGKCIRGVVAVEVRPAHGADVEGVITWIPGDRHPVARHTSWQALYDSLAQRLRAQSYRRYFLRFLSERDRPHFFSTLARLLATTRTAEAVQLDGRHLNIDALLFEHLAAQRIATVLDDARVLAVSTGQEDLADRRERLQAYASAGLDLLGLIGMFVPVLGEIMLVVGAEQIAEQVYEGYQDWQLGDRQGALGHLFGVAQSIAVGVVMAQSGRAVAKALQRVSFVDALAPLCTEAGQVKLGSDELAAYRVPDTDQAVGHLVQDELGSRLRLHDGTYRLHSGADESPRVRHPQRTGAHAPLLEHNGSGGWRHALEWPQQWQGRGYLLRRLSSRLAAVSDATAEDLLLCTGLGEEQLRGLHVEGASAPARLLDALQRHEAHEQFPLLQGDAFEQYLRTGEDGPNAQEALVRRDFPSLSLRAIREVLSQDTSQQIDAMSSSGRVPLSVAQHVRQYLRDSRLDRACAGLRQAQAINNDTERLALGLVEHLAPWPRTVRVELYGAGHGASRSSAGAEGAGQLRLIVETGQGYQLMSGPGADLATGSDSLMRALHLSMDETQRARLAAAGSNEQHLRQMLSVTASSDRELVARLLGLTPINGIRLPRRLGDGRLGYPLSGRPGGGRQTCLRGIQQIYPTMGESRLQRYVLQLTNEGVDLWEHYRGLQRQLSELRTSLRTWSGEWRAPLQSLRRQRVATALRRSWRRKLQNADGEYVLQITGERVTTLPSLPAGLSYAHVRCLTLSDMDLTVIEPDFLERFPNLVELNLSGNRLTSVPPGIERLSQLRQLNLARNSIVMSQAGEQRLKALTRLMALNLSYNPLRRAPVLGNLRFLRSFSMRGANLENLPRSARDLPWRGLMDYRENQLRSVRDELHQLRGRLQQFALHDNPLDESSQAELEAIAGPSSARGSAYRHVADDDGMRSAWVGSAKGELRAYREALWGTLQAEPGSADLFQFLADFTHMDEFIDHTSHFQERIWHILEACEQDEALRTFVFRESGGVRTCEDRLLLILSQLEVGLLGQRALLGGSVVQSERRLVELGRSLYRLDQVDRIAMRHVQALNEADRIALAETGRGQGATQVGEASELVDEIETQLFYRVRLAPRLGLPQQPKHMHYPHVSRVTVADLKRAEAEVKQVENVQALIDSLGARPYWDSYLHQQHGERFLALAEPFHARLEADEALVEAGTLLEADYITRVDALKEQLEAAEQQLRHQLTEEACRRWLE